MNYKAPKLNLSADAKMLEISIAQKLLIFCMLTFFVNKFYKHVIVINAIKYNLAFGT